MRVLAALAVCSIVTGCASPYETRTPPKLDDTQPPAVVCVDKRQCDAMWQAAQLFVLNTSGYKVQLANDVVIQTYGPGRGEELAMMVTRTNFSDGAGEIQLKSACGYRNFDCRPTVGQAGRDFSRLIGAVR